MKFVQSTGSQASMTRRTALLWLLLVVGIALNFRLILRRRILGDDRSLPIPDGRDRSGSVNDPNNDIVSDTGEAGGSVDSGGARRGGVLGDDVQSGPPRSRSSRKEGGDSTGLLGDDVGGGWMTSAKRLEADARGECLFTSNSNVPGVPDLYSYVEAYWDSMVKTRMVDTLEEASKMQAWTTVADMGNEDAVHLVTEDSLGIRQRFLEGLHASTGYKRRKTKVAIVSTISNDVRSLERRVLPWMQYHVDMGVAQFYLFYDGEDPAAVEALDVLPFVRVLTVKSELGADDGVRTRYEMHMSQVHKFSSSTDVQKSNEVLMTKQTFGMDEGVRAGLEDGMDWLLHIDTDELFVPEAHATITQAFEAVDPTEPTIRVLNLEAQLEAGDVTSPFLQVTLFRNHQYFTTMESEHYRSTFKQGMNSGWLYLYSNGKSAVRLDDSTSPAAHGPHYWKPSRSTDGAVNDRWKNRISNSSVILHYAYSNPDELVSKAARSCPQYWGKEGVDMDVLLNECFVLAVDARAFMAANEGMEAAKRFFYGNFVYSEGAPTQCRTYGVLGRSGWCTMTDIADLKELMVRMELMRRFTLPQVVLQRHEHEIRQLQASNMDPDGYQSVYN